MRPVNFIAAALTILICSANAAEIPFLAGHVNDNAGILSRSTSDDLERVLRRHEDSTSNQVVVLTIPSLDGEPLEAYSIRVVDSWKLGQKGKDNGVLLLVVRDDRKVRIEVGRGLEGDFPDITCGLIIRKEILPAFKQGDYNGGITAGVQAILGVIGGSYKAEGGDVKTDSDMPFLIIAGAMFFVVIGIFTLLGVLSRGPLSWILYVFLIPFWFGFPAAVGGARIGIICAGVYLVGFLATKYWSSKSAAGKALHERWGKGLGMSSLGAGSWISSGHFSSGGGFSGGGGGFSGGGASGSW